MIAKSSWISRKFSNSIYHSDVYWNFKMRRKTTITTKFNLFIFKSFSCKHIEISTVEEFISERPHKWNLTITNNIYIQTSNTILNKCLEYSVMISYLISFIWLETIIYMYQTFEKCTYGNILSMWRTQVFFFFFLVFFL